MFQMLVTYANNSAVITETVPNTISRDAQVSLKPAKTLSLSVSFSYIFKFSHFSYSFPFPRLSAFLRVWYFEETNKKILS